MMPTSTIVFLVLLPFMIASGLVFDRALFFGQRPPFWTWMGMAVTFMSLLYMLYETVLRFT